MTRRPPAPPLLPGIACATSRDAPRLAWWALRGYCYGARHGPHRAQQALMVLAWWAILPVLLATQACLLARRRSRYYLSPQRDAVLAVTATRNNWTVEDHLCAHRGRREGQALRQAVVPALLQAADAAHVTVSCSTATPALARRYAAEVPGLTDTGPRLPRGRRMTRQPRTGSAR